MPDLTQKAIKNSFTDTIVNSLLSNTFRMHAIVMITAAQ